MSFEVHNNHYRVYRRKAGASPSRDLLIAEGKGNHEDALNDLYEHLYDEQEEALRLAQQLPGQFARFIDMAMYELELNDMAPSTLAANAVTVDGTTWYGSHQYDEAYRIEMDSTITVWTA